jgi:hypothetical protein
MRASSSVAYRDVLLCYVGFSSVVASVLTDGLMMMVMMMMMM